jgi:hypothetical protein
VGMHRVDGPFCQVGAGLLGKSAQREPLSFADPKRRSHGERSVHEIRLRRDKLYGNPVLGQSPECERCLEARNPGSRYEDIHRHGQLRHHR